ncbi:hypothetical protein ADUPG1_000529 [Aduncisulcus paluster]|uniref:Uncharacterized protein n=1 Tax=Aduncisulcus paluster TaxID=2918883 RepID=A0ABQ5K6P5_9EUKA|nr:hypothetical protein ADUPG1_000529 [Aduncisulcus paluster]
MQTSPQVDKMAGESESPDKVRQSSKYRGKLTPKKTPNTLSVKSNKNLSPRSISKRSFTASPISDKTPSPRVQYKHTYSTTIPNTEFGARTFASDQPSSTFTDTTPSIRISKLESLLVTQKNPVARPPSGYHRIINSSTTHSHSHTSFSPKGTRPLVDRVGAHPRTNSNKLLKKYNQMQQKYHEGQSKLNAFDLMLSGGKLVHSERFEQFIPMFSFQEGLNESDLKDLGKKKITLPRDQTQSREQLPCGGSAIVQHPHTFIDTIFRNFSGKSRRQSKLNAFDLMLSGGKLVHSERFEQFIPMFSFQEGLNESDLKDLGKKKITLPRDQTQSREQLPCGGSAIVQHPHTFIDTIFRNFSGKSRRKLQELEDNLFYTYTYHTSPLSICPSITVPPSRLLLGESSPLHVSLSTLSIREVEAISFFKHRQYDPIIGVSTLVDGLNKNRHAPSEDTFKEKDLKSKHTISDADDKARIDQFLVSVKKEQLKKKEMVCLIEIIRQRELFVRMLKEKLGIVFQAMKATRSMRDQSAELFSNLKIEQRYCRKMLTGRSHPFDVLEESNKTIYRLKKEEKTLEKDLLDKKTVHSGLSDCLLWINCRISEGINQTASLMRVAMKDSKSSEFQK